MKLIRLAGIAGLTLAGMLGAQTVDRTKPPETPPIPAYKMPPVFETKLANGLTVMLVEDGRFPLVTMRLSFLAGSKFDPKDIPGLSSNVAALLTEGTVSRPSQQIAEEMTTIGGTLHANSSPDGLTLAGSALSENAAKLLELAADVALNANFPEDEIQLRKQNRKQGIMAQHGNSAFLATEKFDELVYGDHPYSHISATPESLDRMDQQAHVKFRDTYLVPNNAFLILLGKLPPRAQTLKMVQERFGAWKQKPVPAPPAVVFPASKRALVLVDRPGSAQADIHIGKLGVTRNDPDHFPMVVGNLILGGGPSSRLFMDVREQKGFAYDAHSELDRLRDGGIAQAVMQVRDEVVEPAVEAVLGHLAEMGKTQVSAKELSDAKNYISGSFVLTLETQNSLAAQLDTVKMMGVPSDYLEKYTTHIRSVEPDQIQKAARKYMNPDDATIVVVGDATKIKSALEKFGTVEVTKPK